MNALASGLLVVSDAAAPAVVVERYRALTEIVGALPGAILVVEPDGTVVVGLGGVAPPLAVAAAAGRPLYEALGLAATSDAAGRWELWMACALGQDAELWPWHAADAPGQIEATAEHPALDVDVGPIVENGVVVAAVLHVRRAAAAAAAVAACATPGPAAAPTGVRVDERFISDAAGLLDDCDADLVRLQRDRQARHAVHRMFRAVHTLKGLAGGAQATAIAGLAHTAEDVLHRLRLDGAQVGDLDLAEVRGMLAKLRGALSSAMPPQGETTDAMTRFYSESRCVLPRLERAVALWCAHPRQLHLGEELARLARGFDDAARRARLTRFMARTAELCAQIASGRHHARPPRSLLAAIEQGLDDVGSWLGLYHDVHVELRSHEQGAALATDLAAALASAADAAAARAAVAAVAQGAGLLALAAALAGGEAAVRRGLAAVGDLPAMLVAATTGPLGAGPEAARELERAVAAFARELGTPAAASVVQAFERVQAATTALTWVSLDDVAARVQQVVAATAAMVSRDVALDVDLIGMRLRAATARAVADILVHAVRNAIDHGIEPPAERLAAGKLAAGTIRIRAVVDEALIEITIEDDGRGIDLDRVRRRGAERGLLGADPAATSAEDLFEVLFHPGFSTADSVTQISGRGVGMDVIRTLAAEHGGGARLRSTPGLGTSLIVTLGLAAPAS